MYTYIYSEGVGGEGRRSVAKRPCFVASCVILWCLVYVSCRRTPPSTHGIGQPNSSGDPPRLGEFLVIPTPPSPKMFGAVVSSRGSGNVLAGHAHQGMGGRGGGAAALPGVHPQHALRGVAKSSRRSLLTSPPPPPPPSPLLYDAMVAEDDDGRRAPAAVVECNNIFRVFPARCTL